MRTLDAKNVELDASRWVEDKGSDVRGVDRKMKTLQRSNFENRDVFSKPCTFLHREPAGIWPCLILDPETFSSTWREWRILCYVLKITIKDFKTSQSRFVACSGVG